MPHNVPPTPPPKKRQSFFKKNHSLNETNAKVGNVLAHDLSIASITSGTVSIHRTSNDYHHSILNDSGPQTNGIHNHVNNNSMHSNNKMTSTPSTVPATSAAPVKPLSPMSHSSSRNDEHGLPRIPINSDPNEVTLKILNRGIGDMYLTNAWRRYQFIDSTLYAFADNESGVSIPIPAHRIVLQQYSEFCAKFFNSYNFTPEILNKSSQYIGEAYDNNDHDSKQMTWYNIQRLSGSQNPVLCVPIPFYDLYKLVTLMYIGHVTIKRKSLDSVQKSALILKMSSIEIVELHEMLVNSNGIAPSLSLQSADSSSGNGNGGSNDEKNKFKTACTLSCASCCYSSNTDRASSSPELNITAISPAPELTSVLTPSISDDFNLRQPLSTMKPCPIPNLSIPKDGVKGLSGKVSHDTTQLQNTIFEFLYSNRRTPILSPYLTELMTPPITPSTAGTSSSSGSSSSGGSQYPATPSIMTANPFFSNPILSNFLTSQMHRQMSAPATLTPPVNEHSSSPLFMNNHSKSASADEANSPPSSMNGAPNRKRSQNLVHAAQYRDRRRQKIEQLYAEKEKEEAKVNEQKNIIQKLCGQIEKLIDAQTRSNGDDLSRYRCPICSQTFPQLDAIRMHLNTAHPERTCPSGPLAKAVFDPASNQLHLRSPYRHSEHEQQTIQDWIDAQRIARDNYYSQQQTKQTHSAKSLLAHAHTSSMVV